MGGCRVGWPLSAPMASSAAYPAMRVGRNLQHIRSVRCRRLRNLVEADERVIGLAYRRSEMSGSKSTEAMCTPAAPKLYFTPWRTCLRWHAKTYECSTPVQYSISCAEGAVRAVLGTQASSTVLPSHYTRLPVGASDPSGFASAVHRRGCWFCFAQGSLDDDDFSLDEIERAPRLLAAPRHPVSIGPVACAPFWATPPLASINRLHRTLLLDLSKDRNSEKKADDTAAGNVKK